MSYRPIILIAPTINGFMVSGSDGLKWHVKSVADDRLVMSYDSEELTVEGWRGE